MFSDKNSKNLFPKKYPDNLSKTVNILNNLE